MPTRSTAWWLDRVSRLSIERATSLDELAALEPGWNELLARSGTDTVYLTFEWVSSWMRWIGRDAQPMVLVARNHEGETVGIAPLMITRSRDPGASRGEIQFIGTPNSDYSDFIVLEERERVLRAFFSALRRGPQDWQTMSLREIPESSPNRGPLTGLGRRGAFPGDAWPGNACPSLLLEQREEEVRRELQRKKYVGKRDWEKSIDYAERFGAVQFQHARTLQEAEALLPDLFRLHKARWSGTSKFEDEAYEGFYRSVVTRLWPKGHVAVTAMTLDAKPIAVSLAFPYKGTWTNHNWVHDRDLAKLSPGTLLIHFMIVDALARGYREFDLTRGAESYKRRFSNTVRHNTDLLVYRRQSSYLRARLHGLLSRTRTRVAGGAARYSRRASDR